MDAVAGKEETNKRKRIGEKREEREERKRMKQKKTKTSRAINGATCQIGEHSSFEGGIPSKGHSNRNRGCLRK